MSLSSLQLDAFAEVARRASFSEAATRLHITQSALSQRILNLEQELGATLIIRDPAGARLTEIGQRLLRYCQAREALETEFAEGLKSDHASQLAGHLRIGGFSTVIRSVAIPSLRTLISDNSRLQVEFMTREMRELPALLETARADFIFLDREYERADVISQLLGFEENVLVQAKGKKSPDIYLDHDEEDRTTENFLKLQRKSLKSPRRVYFDEIYTIIDGVLAGLGKAVIPMHIARGIPGLEVVRGLKSLKVPIYFCYYQQSFYTKLQNAVIETINRNSQRALL